MDVYWTVFFFAEKINLHAILVQNTLPNLSKLRSLSCFSKALLITIYTKVATLSKHIPYTFELSYLEFIFDFYRYSK